MEKKKKVITMYVQILFTIIPSAYKIRREMKVKYIASGKEKTHKKDIYSS